MRFKLWLQKEGLTGPGGGATLDDPHDDMMARAKDDAAKGVGALPNMKDEPPKSNIESPTKRYLDLKYLPFSKKNKKTRKLG